MKLSLLLLAATLLCGVAALSPNVQVKNLRLFYGDQEYFIKGVDYSPTPLAKQIEQQTDGTGLCTPHTYVVPGSFSQTETISPCFWDDYMDATGYVGGPSNGFSGLWARDFPLIQSLGVNTLRTYHAFPVTQLSINNDARYTNKNLQGANHIPFLDAAQSHGLKVLFPLWADSADIDAQTPDTIKYYITTLIDEVGNHPALLMYSFGNELQFFARDASYLTLINTFLDYARAYQLQKWGRAVPVTCALIDYPPYYNQMASQLHVDIMTTNAGYRGFDFSDLWSGNGNSFSGWATLSCQSSIPTLIGEMGVHHTTPVFDVPQWFPMMWSDILNHKNQGAIGGFLFSFQEEHWKGVAYYGQDWTQQPDVYMGLVSLTPGTGQFPIDNVVEKNVGAYTWSSAISGFAENQWAQDGPNTLAAVPNNFCAGGSGSTSSGNYPSSSTSGTLTSSSSTTGSSTTGSSSTGSSSTTGSSTGSSSTTSGTSGSSGVSYTRSSSCGTTQYSCGQACYAATSYCCLNGALTQMTFCPAGASSPPSSGTGNAATTGSSTTSSTTSVATPTTSSSANPGGASNLPAAYLYYSLNSVSGNTVTDNSNNGRSAQISGSPVVVGGVRGNGLQFTQSNGLQTLVTSNANGLSGAFSFASWVFIPTALDVRMKVASSKANWNDATGFEVEVYPNPSYNSISVVGSGGSVAYFGPAGYPIGAWFHLAVTVTASGAAVAYVNGNTVGSSGVSPVLPSTRALYIASNGGSAAVTGNLDEIYLFAITLTQSQVSAVMNANSGVLSTVVASTVAPSTVAATPATTSTQNTGSSSATCSPNNCGASACCPDSLNGNLCYSSSNFKCVSDMFNAKTYLCGWAAGSSSSRTASCNGSCYDTTVYTCKSGTLTHL